MDIYFTLWVIFNIIIYLFLKLFNFCHWALLQASFCVLLMCPLPFSSTPLFSGITRYPRLITAPALELSTSPRAPGSCY